MRHAACLCLAIGLVIISSVAVARDVRIGFAEHSEPFVIGDVEHPGISVEIARKAFGAVGHTVVPVFHSYKRIIEEVRHGRLDGAAGCCSDGEQALHYSQPCIAFNNVAIVRKTDDITVESIADLPGHTVVAWQNAHDHLGGQFQELFGRHVTDDYIRKYFDLPDQSAQVRMFWSGRADIIVIDDVIFDYLTSTLSNELDTTQELERHAIFGGPTVFSIVFNDPALRDEFNRGLALLRESGEYDKIYDKYRTVDRKEAQDRDHDSRRVQKSDRSMEMRRHPRR